jgi:integrase
MAKSTGTGTLTALAIKSAHAGKHFDGGGLYLEVTDADAKYWRLKFRFAGKENRLSFGVFPEVSLAEARKRRDDARSAIRDGRDPSLERKADKRQKKLAAENSFQAIGNEWLAMRKKKLAPATFAKAEWMLGDLLNPWLGAMPISTITAPDLLDVLRKIEARGAHESAHRAKQCAGSVFRFAIATGRARHNPATELREALHPVVSKNRAAVTDPVKVGELLRAIHGYTGSFVTCCALRLAPLTFVRPGELRQAEWKEVDLDAKEWRIPAAKMKMREEHIIPLAAQAVAVLREVHALTGRGRYVFPSIRTPAKPMSENTINAALRGLGYDKNTMCGHGFRALASTRLNELGWASEVIERQLAHAERNKVRAAYNRAQYMAERRKMMQAWADYLDGLRVGGKVIAFKGKRAK